MHPITAHQKGRHAPRRHIWGGRAWDARDPAPAHPCLWRASGGLRPCVSWELRFYLPFYSWPNKKKPARLAAGQASGW